MKKQFIFLVIFTLISIAGYSFIAIQIEPGQALGVEINFSKPVKIIWPCEIDYIGDQGEKGLRIPPNVGRGWLNEAGGSAIYKFFIPSESKYYLWTYCKWHGECSNAVYAKIDNLEKSILGNDPIYDKWHWVRGFPVELIKGTHTLTLENHSDNIELQKMVLLNSKSATPNNSDVVFSDFFYDGFNGCAKGNFLKWKIVSGKWQVMDPATQLCKAENSLKGESNTQAMIIYTNNSWENYSLDVEIKAGSLSRESSEIGVCFGVQGKEDYYNISFVPQIINSTVTAALSRQSQNKNYSIQTYSLPWSQKEWHHLRIMQENGKIIFKLDDQEANAAPLHNEIPVKGGIGFYLKGNVTAYFDNIHVREIRLNSVDGRQDNGI